ncbi:hypothetical protein JRO89_XS03G0334700 [Xanthoceras sorbifolium]|uniref:Cwf15/Cwc15 cell cycle control protein n=1 Tax=Xanthoceras sorbifolium TaxID=99658 RepID=A0ABQ8IDH5_9ROSI|nr:hypothetical protein JRO89_XS03G0334700 [Xanthoceras sorbifolium]
MTTAARPTWAPAKGGNEQGGTRIFGPSQKYSSRDLAAHTNLKPRLDDLFVQRQALSNNIYVTTLELILLDAQPMWKEGQDTLDELQKRNLRDELEERERRHFSSKDKSYADDRDRRKGSHLLLEVKWSLFVYVSDDEDDDDEDDTEALLAELEQIKKERAEEKLRKDKQQWEEEAKVKEAELLRGNPLMNNPTSFNVKRRWDDDVVFKNQARGETKTPKRFINDTIRNDFHRKFLQKYMK